jgi:hypothetical protein
MPCDHPECSADVANSYTGPHDNELRLCEAHYYYLVAEERPPTDDRISTPSFEVPPQSPSNLGRDVELPDGRESPLGRRRQRREF